MFIIIGFTNELPKFTLYHEEAISFFIFVAQSIEIETHPAQW